jgi:hypothetical protein
MKKARTDVSVVYTSEDGTVYDSTDGWRIESYGSDKVIAREVAPSMPRLPRARPELRF